ncbi:hypothetical protein ZWY2020_000940 [Hordeum vulgare]|nr:hypothetical protein ZWY2020_000940 [Hordeum vulgare]
MDMDQLSYGKHGSQGQSFLQVHDCLPSSAATTASWYQAAAAPAAAPTVPRWHARAQYWCGSARFPASVVSSPEAAREVLKTNDLVFANRPARQVRRIESIQQAEVARLLESVSAAATACAVVDVGKALAELSSNIIATAVFGGKFPQQEAFLREIDVLSVLVGGFSMADLFPSSRLVRWLSSATHDVKRSHARVQRILEDIIQERKEKTSKNGSSSAARDNEDLLDVLLRLQRDDTLGFPLTSEIIDCVIRY